MSPKSPWTTREDCSALGKEAGSPQTVQEEAAPNEPPHRRAGQVRAEAEVPPQALEPRSSREPPGYGEGRALKEAQDGPSRGREGRAALGLRSQTLQRAAVVSPACGSARCRRDARCDRTGPQALGSPQGHAEFRACATPGCFKRSTYRG